MQKVTTVFLMLALACMVSSQADRPSNKLRRQIFDTIDFNSGYKSAKIPARQNQIQSSGKAARVTGYTYETPSTSPNTYLPPTTTKPTVSTPGPKYLIPKRNYTTTSTTYRPLGTFPTYTGTFPTYKTSSYTRYNGTFPPPLPTMKPLTTTTTTPKPIGYEYNQPSLIFNKEEVPSSRG